MTDDFNEPRPEHIAGSGWAGLDELNQKFSSAPAPQEDELARLGGLALSVFSTDEGAQLLDWMLSQTMRRSSVPDVGVEQILMKPEALASFVLWNEAQKAFVLRLVALMEAGKRSTKKQRRVKR